MIVFRISFCYAGWKPLHIPIAIIKLSGLNVFICIYIFCERRTTKKCLSNQNARSECFNCFSYLPVNICICIPLRTLFAQTGYVISAFTHAEQTEREWQANINNPILLPGIVVLLVTVLYSEWHNVAQQFPILVLSSSLGHCRIVIYYMSNPIRPHKPQNRYKFRLLPVCSVMFKDR